MPRHSQLTVLRKLAQVDIDRENTSVAALVRTMERSTTPKRATASLHPYSHPLPLRSSTPVRRVATFLPINARSEPAANPAICIKAPAPDLLFTFLRHLEGECLRHPASKCACEAVRTPILDHGGAWQIMRQRFNDSRNPPSPRDHPAKERLSLSLPPSPSRPRTASVRNTTCEAVQTATLDQGKAWHFLGQRLSSLRDHPAKELLSLSPSVNRCRLRTASVSSASTRDPAPRQQRGETRSHSIPSPPPHSQLAEPLPRVAAYRKAAPLFARDALRGSPVNRHSPTAGTRGGWAHTLRG
ncbi:hypothetical protein T484DRAFT_1748986 [Baffinella frigidus]|nr:hypothetical protein T484DRAFT_1748986 [Cryptophyta sp. CCMP2293]